MRFLFIFFVIVPLVEMSLLFAVSDEIGGLSTIALVVLTAAVGIQILKRQGLSTLMRANQRISSGELPAQEIIEGMMLAAAGALLLTPGFITDTLGFVFLAAPLRRPIAAKLIKMGVASKMSASGSGPQFAMYSSVNRPPPGAGDSFSANHASGNVFEGEIVEDVEALQRSEAEKPD